ncbi:uncharacterized protein C7orf50 homolog isoform X9 [Mirounga angustirostris]|uniref:uncharacterized protein C7orf50 homolog isoform X9 n=1 Tax=Mirounga angustirostris TaxID=9716 RepID=UPI0023E41FDC|nr:uncharacterized protein C7orf50 homolog isoform X3 [Mirounga angustirostris]
MEFPDLGKHCSEKTCKQLDFLPLKCDACKQDFCKDHFTCAAHKCPFAFKKDVQVPVCPLCNNPVPVKKGEIPDVVVGEHIDRDCNYHPRKKEKLFMYRCSKEGCKKKEMLQVACDQCRGSFCIQHRHPLDHSCKHGGRPVGAARMAKQKRKVTEMTEEKNKKLKKASTKEIQLAPRAVSGTKRAHPENITCCALAVWLLSSQCSLACPLCFQGLYGNVARDSGAGRGPGSALPHSEWSQSIAYLEGKHSYSIWTIFFPSFVISKMG